MYYTSQWNQTPELAAATGGYKFEEVHYLGGKFVAVGYHSVPSKPVFAYSEDGENWTIGAMDLDFIEEVRNGGDLSFTDVGYNGDGYFIVAFLDGEAKAGAFYTTDLTQELNGSNYITPENFPTDANQLVYAGAGNFGVWSVFSDDGKTWWSTFHNDPSQPWDDFITGWDLTNILMDEVGLNNLQITEATIGQLAGQDGESYVTWMVSTADGQVIWWPHVPAGPFVTIPKPFSVSLDSVLSSNPVTISTTGDYSPLNGERITISGATGLPDINGSYFVDGLGNNVYRLYSDKDLTSGVNGDSWSGSYNHNSATVKLSRGTRISALGYGNGKFFAGNDDDEVFMCNGTDQGNVFDWPNYPELRWTKVEDANNSLQWWNDVEYGDMWNDVEYGDISNCGSETYTLNLTPQHPETIQNYKYDGEGNMDTSIVIDEHGNRVSIQRTGYVDTVDSCGRRKVVEVKDGETYDNVPR